jgi:hypothetical protein
MQWMTRIERISADKDRKISASIRPIRIIRVLLIMSVGANIYCLSTGVGLIRADWRE